MGALQDILAEPTYALGVHDNVVIVLWRSPLEPAALNELDKRLAAAVKASPDGVGLVSVVKNAQGVGAGLRRMHPRLERHAPSLRAVGAAIEGEGVGVTLSRLRASLGLGIRKPPGVAYRVTPAAAEAAVFVMHTLGAAGLATPQASALSFSLEHLRGKMAP